MGLGLHGILHLTDFRRYQRLMLVQGENCLQYAARGLLLEVVKSSFPAAQSPSEGTLVSAHTTILSPQVLGKGLLAGFDLTSLSPPTIEPSSSKTVTKSSSNYMTIGRLCQELH